MKHDFELLIKNNYIINDISKEELCFDEYKSMIEQALFYSKRKITHLVISWNS